MLKIKSLRNRWISKYKEKILSSAHEFKEILESIRQQTEPNQTPVSIDPGECHEEKIEAVRGTDCCVESIKEENFEMSIDNSCVVDDKIEENIFRDFSSISHSYLSKVAEELICDESQEQPETPYKFLPKDPRSIYFKRSHIEKTEKSKKRKLGTEKLKEGLNRSNDINLDTLKAVLRSELNSSVKECSECMKSAYKIAEMQNVIEEKNQELEKNTSEIERLASLGEKRNTEFQNSQMANEKLDQQISEMKKHEVLLMTELAEHQEKIHQLKKEQHEKSQDNEKINIKLKMANEQLKTLENENEEILQRNKETFRTTESLRARITELEQSRTSNSNSSSGFEKKYYEVMNECVEIRKQSEKLVLEKDSLLCELKQQIESLKRNIESKNFIIMDCRRKMDELEKRPLGGSKILPRKPLAEIQLESSPIVHEIVNMKNLDQQIKYPRNCIVDSKAKERFFFGMQTKIDLTDVLKEKNIDIGDSSPNDINKL